MTVSSLTQYIAVNLYKRDKRGRLPPPTIFPVSFFPKRGQTYSWLKITNNTFRYNRLKMLYNLERETWPGLSSFKIVVFISTYVDSKCLLSMKLSITKLSRINWFLYSLVLSKILACSSFICLDVALQSSVMLTIDFASQNCTSFAKQQATTSHSWVVAAGALELLNSSLQFALW